MRRGSDLSFKGTASGLRPLVLTSNVGQLRVNIEEIFAVVAVIFHHNQANMFAAQSGQAGAGQAQGRPRQ